MKAQILLALLISTVACNACGQDTKSSPPSQSGSLDILTDTKGVDFGPYIAGVVHKVKVNWYSHLPSKVYPPGLKSGKLAIEFSILKEGTVSRMVVSGPSGDVDLDRAAWDGIKESSPFAKLPEKFPDNEIKLRFRFYYNPPKN